MTSAQSDSVVLFSEITSQHAADQLTVVSEPIAPATACIKNPDIRSVAEFLIDLGLPALPVALAQDPSRSGQRKARFTGKNPSYLDRNGKPHLIKHQVYQDRLPTAKEYESWFENPLNGIGTLGGWDDGISLDFDVKQFDSQEECDRAYDVLLEANPQLRQTWREQTQGGGYRIMVKVREKPSFTNFALEPGGKHRGEALGEGRFTVLAPTIGVSGNAYHCINRAIPVEVKSLESIGIYPCAKPRTTTAPQRKIAPATPGAITLEQLGNQTATAILQGNDIQGDRSATLVTAYREWCGWENWAANNGIAVSGSAADLAHQAGEALGIDADRIDRILKSIDPAECQPAAQHRSGDESCWKKIKRLNKQVLAATAPQTAKDALKGSHSRPIDQDGKGNADNREQTQQKQSGGRIPVGFHPKTGAPILPKPSTVASVLAEAYRETIALNVETDQFYRYDAQTRGIWSAEPLPFIQSMVQAELDASGLQDSYGSDYVSSIIGLMKGRLAVRQWDEARGLLPLQNGVLDLATLKLMKHSPGYRLTWQLPYEYDPIATCKPIQDWMLEAQDGDEQRVQLLRAYLKAIVCGRTDLQRFAECLGPGGTGKSTYTRLAIALVGLQNTFTTELKQLESNRFETSGIYGKRLVVISDSERYGGTVTVLKALTGQDMIRNEQKFRQQGAGFVSEAMVLIAANEAIQTNDYTSGLERRRVTIPFLNQIAPEQRRDLLTVSTFGMSGEFVPHLPGLLNWVLAMPDDEMRSFILTTPASVSSLAKWKADSLIESNPIAEWLDSQLVLVPTNRVYVGVARKVRETTGEPGNTTSIEYWEKADSWLYPSYVQCCHDLGNRPISVKRFVNLLEDLLRSQLRFASTRGRDAKGSYFEGIAIRSSDDNNTPRPISGSVDGSVMAEVMGCDGTLTAESTGSVAFDGCDGFSEVVPPPMCGVSEETQPIQMETSTDSVSAVIREKKTSHPSKTTLPTVSLVTPPDTLPITSLKVGDRGGLGKADPQMPLMEEPESLPPDRPTVQDESPYTNEQKPNLLDGEKLNLLLQAMTSIKGVCTFDAFYLKYQQLPDAQQRQIWESASPELQHNYQRYLDEFLAVPTAVWEARKSLLGVVSAEEMKEVRQQFDRDVLIQASNLTDKKARKKLRRLVGAADRLQ